ncbi:hypothetical protein [Streptomyces sp. SAS_260]|uniref:hypothetical protein n=1 Tax=Streptomyces sp. SAS_260 TaxID=3412751 RepID=UPI00403C014B
MDPELLSILAPAAAAAIAALASSHLRQILQSIFRRPRQTSVIVEVDGKRVELTGPLDMDEVEAVVARLRTASKSGQEESTTTVAGGEPVE